MMGNHKGDKIDFQYLKKVIETLEKREARRPAPVFLTFIVTWFFTGKSPIAPGTVGSIAAYPLYFYIVNKMASIAHAQYLMFFIAIILMILGSWAIDRYQSYTKTHDNSSIVIDEVAGMIVILGMSLKSVIPIAILLSPHLYWFNIRDISFIVVFVIFRILDITKPLGISYLDRKIKNGFGVMLDDIAAAIMGSIIIYVISLFLAMLR